MPKISIIIPVYNTEKYLRECLDSVINQTLKDIEILCINDGSTDNSLEILKEYSVKDKRIKIFNQKNSGVSTARNNGLKRASGKYIMFIDSDDLIEEKTCETIYQKINILDSDILVFGLDMLENTERCPSRFNKFLVNTDCIYDVPIQLQTYSVNKIYKNDFIKKYKLNFPKHIKSAEDGVFCLLCSFCKPKYSITEDSLYVYRRNEFSQTIKNAKYCINTDLEALKYLTRKKKFKKTNIENKKNIINKFLGGAMYYWDNFPIYREFYLKDLKNYFKHVIKYMDYNSLCEMENFRKLMKVEVIKQTFIMAEKSFTNNIFKIQKSHNNTHLEISILGIKIKIKRKRESA